jgi:AcrR family transcriptional regulator
MDEHMEEAVKAKRPRNPEATRADLLKAARKLFSRHGYEMVGLRQISAETHVNQALVSRYFGSKLGLFAEAIEGLFSPARWFEGDRKSAGWRMAAWIASVHWPPEEDVDPLTLLIKSCGHPEANDDLRNAFDAQAIKPLAAWLGGPRADERAGVLAGLVIGAILLRQVVNSSAFAGADPEAISASLGAAMQCVVDDVAEEYRGGEARRGLAKRQDVSPHLPRGRVEKYEAGAFNDDDETADLIQQYETRIAALERLAGKQALDLEHLQGLREGRHDQGGRRSVNHRPDGQPSEF